MIYLNRRVSLTILNLPRQQVLWHVECGTEKPIDKNFDSARQVPSLGTSLFFPLSVMSSAALDRQIRPIYGMS